MLWERGRGEGQMFTYNYFVGHLKGTELLRRCYEAASAKANQSRTPLHPVQHKSTAINSTPTNITIINRISLHSSQSPQPSPTHGDVVITKGNSTTPLYTTVAVTMTTEVTELEMDSTKEGSTEVTPERLVTLSSGSTTKRRLKLEEASSCKPQTKRRRTSKRDSSGSSGKKSVAKSGCSLKKLNAGQRTMQSYFQPAWLETNQPICD